MNGGRKEEGKEGKIKKKKERKKEEKECLLRHMTTVVRVTF